MADVDNSDWNAGRAMRECDSAADFGRICAGKRSGDPSLRASWALPHHYLRKAPTPNANGVRNALARLGSTQGLTNTQAARDHLEAHMRQVNPDYQASLTDEGRLIARMPVETWDYADSGQPGSEFSVRGYAAVFNMPSHDMGGFRTKLDPHVLDEVLASEPDVHFVWDHDTRYVGARTKNGTLRLETDDYGLWIEAKIGRYAWARDLRVAMERGDIDQGSIAIGIAEDSWEVTDDDEIFRTVMKADGLYDATVTAQGAFPQTSLAAAYSLVRAAAAEGRLPERFGDQLVTPDEGEESSRDAGDGAGGDEEEDVRVVRLAAELRNRYAVRRDEVARMIERSNKL